MSIRTSNLGFGDTHSMPARSFKRSGRRRRRISLPLARKCRVELLEARQLLATVNVFADPIFPEANEGGPAPAVFRFERNAELDELLTVRFQYGGGTATPDVDFRVFETSVTFEPSSDTAYTAVLPIDDLLNEAQETIRISLQSDPAYTLGSNTAATVPLNNVFFNALPGIFDANEPGLPGDLFYLDANILGGVLTVDLGINGVNFANPTAFEVFIDADQKPLTGDFRQGFVRGAEYRIDGLVLGLGDIFQLYRLPTQPGQQPTVLGQANIVNLGNGFFRMQINTNLLGSTDEVDVFAAGRRNQPNRVTSNGDRTPDFGWFSSSDRDVVVRNPGATTLRTFVDPAGDSQAGALDITALFYASILDQVSFTYQFAQGFDPTSIAHPTVFGALTVDSDRDITTGGIPLGIPIPSWGGDAELFWSFSNGISTQELRFEPTAGDNVEFGGENNDGRWRVVGNQLTFGISAFALDAQRVFGTGPVIVPPGIEAAGSAVQRVLTNGKMLVTASTLTNPFVTADALPGSGNIADAATGEVLEPLESDPSHVTSATDPLELLNPISPTDITGVAFEMIDDNFVVQTNVASFVTTTVNVFYEVLIDLDNNHLTGRFSTDPLNLLNAVGADFIMQVFSIDGGLGPVYFANLIRPNGSRALHEALVNFFPVPVQGTGGGFIVTIPLTLLNGFGFEIAMVNQFRFLVSSGEALGAGGVDAAPTTPMVVRLSEESPLPGDYNGDGVVSATDYGVWRASFGANSGPAQRADGNGDGVVDTADFVVWRNNSGNHKPPGIAVNTTGSHAAVPDGAADRPQTALPTALEAVRLEDSGTASSRAPLPLAAVDSILAGLDQRPTRAAIVPIINDNSSIPKSTVVLSDFDLLLLAAIQPVVAQDMPEFALLQYDDDKADSDYNDEQPSGDVERAFAEVFAQSPSINRRGRYSASST
jgi:hypothetical protein